MIGRTFNDFTVVSLIGSGGMGHVYLAVQNSLEREVAIKIITPHPLAENSGSLIERFLREAKIAASIQHPNIVGIYSVGREEGFFYIAMEYILGSSLESLIVQGPLSESFAWGVALQLCHALQAALQKGVIHRDIKPANILLTSQKLVKLTDFGLSKKIDAESHLTQDGVILGTPYYLSPEQASCEEADFRSDIYSLGATMYQALTGEPLYSGNIMSILWQHKFEPVVPPQDRVPNLKIQSSAILGKMLAKKPGDRYQSYGDLIADIDSLLAGKELTFATAPAAYSVYTHSPAPSPSQHMKTKRKIQSLFGWTSKNKSQAELIPLILVSGVARSNLQQYLDAHSSKAVQVVILTSIPELDLSLGATAALVIVDSDYLGVRTVDFLNHLRSRRPDTAVQILIDANVENAPQGILALPYRGDEEMLARLLSQHLSLNFHAGQINLDMLLFLATKASWSTVLKVNPRSDKEGSIILSHGNVVEARQNQLKGSLAMNFLRQNDRYWQTDTERTTPESLGATDNLGKSKVKKTGQAAQISTKTVLVTPEEAVENIKPLPPDPLLPWKILLVYPEQSQGENTAELMNNRGLMSLYVNTAEDALAMLNIESFDTVVSEARMSRFEGMPLYREIARIYPAVRQIVLSPSPDSQSAFPSVTFVGERGGTSVIEIIREWQKKM